MPTFLQVLIPAMLAYGLGVVIAWFIWGGDRSSER